MAILRSLLKAFLSCFPSSIPQKPMALTKSHLFTFKLVKSLLQSFVSSIRVLLTIVNYLLTGIALFVSPIFKKGSRSDPSNYRPISLTSVLCKTLEHISYSNIMSHLEEHSLLSDLQHGFRKGFSCKSQLILTLHDLAKHFEHKLQTNLVLLDFSKAFDSFPHQSLLLKLASYGMRGHTLTWIEFS